MRKYFIDHLASGSWITAEQHQTILEWLKSRPFSLHWELRILLYCGVLLLAAGMGIIIYDNIDTIGHTAIILLIAGACGYCFYYCYSNRLPFSTGKVTHQSPWYDYVLLLGCLLFLVLEGYLQFQYNLFGTDYRIATLLPAILFLGLAYYFDHAGVLSMGITALASFAGVTVSPGIIYGGTMPDVSLIFTMASLSVCLIGTGFIFKVRTIKRHFTFTWYNFGFNLYFIAMLAAMFTKDYPYIYFGLHVIGCALLFRYAIYEKSFYFLLCSVIYGYIAFTWLVFQSGLSEVFGLYYFAISCIAVIWFFINYKKLFKIK